jgi:hypothetical protein
MPSSRVGAPLSACDLLLMRKQQLTKRKFTLQGISRELKIPVSTLSHYLSGSFAIPEERLGVLSKYFGFPKPADLNHFLKELWGKKNG